jgi:hypothetical protein
MYDFLPGQLILQAGDIQDYHQLARFHYRAPRPATICLIRRAVYIPRDGPQPILAGVATLSWPTLSCRVREAYFGLAAMDNPQRARWLRDHLRTISRVIVHPRFRGIGLASQLAHCLCDDCPTSYIEAIAAMAPAHPLFEQAGMTGVTPVYYIKQTQSDPIENRASSLQTAICRPRSSNKLAEQTH